MDANIGKLLAFEKSILQRLWRCGGSGGVRIQWGMWEGVVLALATHWQSGSSVAQWLPTLANSWLLKSQFCIGCGGVEGVEG